jgi:hypothetical protein
MGTPADMPRIMRPRKYGGAIIENGQRIAYRSETTTSVGTDGPTNSKDENNDLPY